MDIRLTALAASAFFVLSACAGEADSETSDTTADFAARINGDGGSSASAPATPQAPRIAEPIPGAAPGAFVPGTLTDPQSANCGANRMGSFIGQQASDPVRAAVMEAAGDNENVRFVLPGSDNVEPDATSARLNLMLDGEGIIRDARCG